MVEFYTGELLLAKIGSDPYWPSIVMPFCHIPSHVLNKKHMQFLKSGRPCVLFFQSGKVEYFFASHKRVLKVNRDEALKLRNEHSKDHDGIRDSFDEMIEYMDDDDEGKFEKLLRDLDIIADDEEFELGSPFPESETTKVTPEKKNARTKTSTSTKTPTAKSAKGTASRKRSLSTNYLDSKNPESKSEPQLKKGKEEDRVFTKCREFRSVLQRRLLQRKKENDHPTLKEAQECDTALNELVDFAREVNDVKYLNDSRLHKVLRAILKTPELKNLHGIDFHERAELILLDWAPLVLAIKMEKERAEQGSSATPNSTADLPPNTSIETVIEFNKHEVKQKEESQGATNGGMKAHGDTKQANDANAVQSSTSIKSDTQDNLLIETDIKPTETEVKRGHALDTDSEDKKEEKAGTKSRAVETSDKSENNSIVSTHSDLDTSNVDK